MFVAIKIKWFHVKNSEAEEKYCPKGQEISHLQYNDKGVGQQKGSYHIYMNSYCVLYA